MRVYNPQNDLRLKKGLVRTLATLRSRRGFDPAVYIAAKCALLNEYMRKNKLKACVVGISGGVDSALVLALAATAAQQPRSPIKRIVPLLLPVHSTGATNQDVATARGRELLKRFDLHPAEADLTQGYHAIKSAIDTATGIMGKDWAGGQLVSYMRTPAIYYATSLLAQEGFPAVVLGTTNRDEGSYLGFIGKASDAMVDIQMISDLHKSEVYSAAKAFSVPSSILQATPTGDMYDGRVDTEVFGASYDFVELFLAMKCIGKGTGESFAAAWNAAEKKQYKTLSSNLENLHKYNAHKYLVGSPAVHLDVYPSAVPGGWRYGPKDKLWTETVDEKFFVAPFKLSAALLKKFKDNSNKTKSTRTPPPPCAGVQKAVRPSYKDSQDAQTRFWTPAQGGGGVLVVDSLLGASETNALIKEIEKQKWLPAGTDGMRKNFDPEKDQTGSWRASSYCTELSYVLWQRLAGKLPMLDYIPPGTSADAHDAVVWRAVGISPLFKFIKYTEKGLLVAHYDAPYDFGDSRRTLKSMIVYLTKGGKDSATRFIKDLQETRPPLKRNYADWNRAAKESEVLLRVSPDAGSALIFNHRVLHDAAPLTQQSPVKIIMRADVVYEKVLVP